jgi:hypothetical protein
MFQRSTSIFDVVVDNALDCTRCRTTDKFIVGDDSDSSDFIPTNVQTANVSAANINAIHLQEK